MLSSVHVQRYKSCFDITLDDIAGVMLLMGPNGAGKTNFLKSIEWAARTAVTGLSTDDWHAYHSGAFVRLLFSSDDWSFCYHLLGSLQPDDESVPRPHSVEELFCMRAGDKDWFRIARREGKQIWLQDREAVTCPTEQGAITYAFLSFDDSDPYRFPCFFAWRFLRNIGYYPLLVDEKEAVMFSGEDLKKYTASFSRGSLLKEMVKLQQNKPDSFAEVQAILSESTLNLLSSVEIETFSPKGPDESPPPDSNILYYPTFTPVSFGKGRFVTYSDLSFGTRRLLSLIVSMVADESALMLIEQPEDGIHPGLLKRLLAVLKGYADPQQFLITSHSPAVINVVPPTAIRLVEMNDGITSIRPLSPDELSQAGEYVRSEGTLYDFVTALES